MRLAYLIDYSNFCYRFKDNFSKLSVTVKGVEVKTGLLYGFIRALKSNIFNDIFICLDGSPTINTNLLNSYKGQRLKEPEESHSIPRVEIIKVLANIGPLLKKNIHVVASPNQEADQVISSSVYQITGQADQFEVSMDAYSQPDFNSDWRLAKFAKDATISLPDLTYFDGVVIASTDSDMYQLLSNDRVFMDSSTNGSKTEKVIETPKAVHHLSPNSIVAYKAICGDISDNVPSLDIPKDVPVFEIIDKEFSDRSVFFSFKSYLFGDSRQNLSDSVKSLADYIIKSNQVTKFRINNQVTELRYFTTPRVLKHPDVNVISILSKYKLKI